MSKIENLRIVVMDITLNLNIMQINSIKTLLGSIEIWCPIAELNYKY